MVHEPPPAALSTLVNVWMETRLAAHGSAGRVLDLGCGRGYWLRRMVARGIGGVGVEPAIPLAATAAADGPALAAEAERLPFPDGAFAVVWCIHVLHHLPDVPAALAEAHRVLRPGGVLLLAETVEDNPLLRAGRDLFPRWDAAPVRSRFRWSQLRARLADAGFDVEEHRQYGMVSFAAWLLPAGATRTWQALAAVEQHAPQRLKRLGAHVELVARRPPAPATVTP